MSTATSLFRFVLVKVHPKLDLTGWYLVIDDLDWMMEMHRSAAQSMFLKFGLNPHLCDPKTGRPVSDLGHFFNPVKMSAGWLGTAHHALLEHGVIYMNGNHGLLYGENVEILEERLMDEIHFPKEEKHKEGVWITIARWGDGEHYYLSCSTGAPVFSKNKFDTAEEALAEAKRHAFDANIKFGSTYPYSRDGD